MESRVDFIYLYIYRVGVLQFLATKIATADNGAFSYLFLAGVSAGVYSYRLWKECLLSVKHDKCLVQMRENSKHNNIGFITKSSPEKIYHQNSVQSENDDLKFNASNEEKDKDKKPWSRENIV